MLIELLNTQERRATILPELVAFFESQFSTNWESALEAFVKRFAGTEFRMPTPIDLSNIKRDQDILARLEQDRSVNVLLELLREHSITHAYIKDIWLAVKGEHMPPPPCCDGKNRAAIVETAAGFIKLNPRMVNEIVTIFSLSAREHARAIEMAGVAAKNPFRGNPKPMRKSSPKRKA